MSSEFEVKFVEKEHLDLEGFTLIEGFPGMGLVGTISAKYLVEKCNFKEVGFIDSDSFIPIIRIHQGLPVHPSRIYINESKKLVVLISEQIIPRQFTQKVADAIVDWVEEKAIKRIVSLSGINSEGSEAVKGKVKLYGIATNEASKKILEEHGIEVIKEGITTGVTALILLGLKGKDIEAISILGTVTLGADYKASAEILRKLNEVLSLNINVEPLLKEARETEKDLLKQLQKLKESHDTVRKIEDQTPMYA